MSHSNDDRGDRPQASWENTKGTVGNDCYEQEQQKQRAEDVERRAARLPTFQRHSVPHQNDTRWFCNACGETSSTR